MLALNDPAHPGHRTQAISTHGLRAERIWTPTLVLDQEVQTILIDKCQSHYRELCGFVSSDEEIWCVDNVHLEPKHNFYMDNRHVEEVLTEIYKIQQTSVLGQFHTHPNNVPWPSPRDIVGWPNPALGWHYWIVTNEEVIEWQLVSHTDVFYDNP